MPGVVDEIFESQVITPIDVFLLFATVMGATHFLIGWPAW